MKPILISFCCAWAASANLVQHRPQVAEERRRVLAHREVAEALHDRHLGAGNARGGRFGIARRGRIVVLAGEHVQRALAGVDCVQAATDVTFDLIEVQVARKDARPALHVMPHRLPAVLVGAERRHQAVGEPARRATAMHFGVVHPARVVVALDIRGGLQADERAQLARVLEREMQHDASADRAAHHHRALEAELVRDAHHHRGVGVGAQAIRFIALPERRRRALAVPRHVERHNPVVFQYLGVIKHRAVLAPIGAGGVQAKKRDALARFLVVDAMRASAERDVCVAAGDRLDHWRSAASASLR